MHKKELFILLQTLNLVLQLDHKQKKKNQVNGKIYIKDLSL